jgi:hypothetical protein
LVKATLAWIQHQDSQISIIGFDRYNSAAAIINSGILEGSISKCIECPGCRCGRWRESLEAGATVPMVSQRHGVLANRIYAWRQDKRFQGGSVETPGFATVEVTDAPGVEDITQHAA